MPYPVLSMHRLPDVPLLPLKVFAVIYEYGEKRSQDAGKCKPAGKNDYDPFEPENRHWLTHLVEERASRSPASDFG